VPGSASVLVVDDSAVQRDHAVKLCQAAGFEHTHTAANGHEALSTLSGLVKVPDLLIIDLEMPAMDGSQLLDRLHQLGIDAPIIVASSREHSLLELVADLGSALGLRIIGALQKPLTAESLHQSLRRSTHWPKKIIAKQSTGIDAASLSEAIRTQSLHVHYQPKVEMRTGLVRGVEALARWTHATLGAVSPADFIRVAEAHDLIHDLTLLVMDQAMLQTAAWMARGLHLSLAVNLSPRLLDRPALADEIIAIQERHALPANQIVFELTEGSIVSSRGAALGSLARLRLRGFGLSIDDYGTGFSSLQQLARFPFTELKLDRSLVAGAHERKNLQVILRSALDMADKLGIKSVAEGIELLEEWRLLQELGCNFGQGYLIAKPMSGPELTTWMKECRLSRSDLGLPA